MRSSRALEWAGEGRSWRAALDAWGRVEAALDGSGPPVCPDPGRVPECDLADGTALLIGTSGSTGMPKFAQLTAASLRAPVDGVHAHLGGPGQWLLSLPPSHITGFQAALRSYTAGYPPACLPSGPFTPASFVDGVRLLDDSAPRHYTTLVPTQLVRILEDPAAVEAARRLDALLIGGAPLSPSTAARARTAGLRLAIGYGASETAGGCLYDGRPLPCARVRLDTEGRLVFGGPMIAHGYAGRPDLDARAFVTADGMRWFRTDDLGVISPEGRVTVLGRADDVINTGGLKVAPRVVQDAICEAFPAVADVVVVGVPDVEWGESVSAAVVMRPGTSAPSLTEVRERVDLPGYARPRRLLTLPALPLTGPGKHDRGAVRALFVG